MERTVYENIDHLFRHQYGRIMAGLLSRFGTKNVNLVEDAVQDALLKAMKLWPHQGQPDNAAAWLYKVAQNQMLDSLKRQSKSTVLEVNKMELTEQEYQDSTQLNDEQLQLVFACCHPNISDKESLLLSLKLVGGFSSAEIGRALLLKEEAAKKSIQRAKSNFKEKVGSVYFPKGKELELYLNRVVRVVYLIFNEGYKPSKGASLINEDLCGEAIRLGLLLNDNKHCSGKDVQALLSLMCFKCARFEARINSIGELLTLENQDWKKWNQQYVQWGFYYFNLASRSQEASSYQLEAAIEFYYHSATGYDFIDWEKIGEVYRLLLLQKDSMNVKLNYLVVLEKTRGTDFALHELTKLEGAFEGSALYHSIKAFFYENKKEFDLALVHLEKTLLLTDNEVEQGFLKQRIQKVTKLIA